MFRNIYLVEDDCDDSQIFSLAVNEINPGYNLTLFCTGQALFDKLFNDEILPDIIFIDLYLPDFYGLQLVIEIKKIEKYAHIPLIIYSGSNYEDLITTAYNTGANYYMVKPLKFSDYKTSIEKILLSDW